MSQSCNLLGHAVVHLVKGLSYTLGGRGFDSRLCHWDFSLTYSFWPPYSPGFDSASNRNEVKKVKQSRYRPGVAQRVPGS